MQPYLPHPCKTILLNVEISPHCPWRALSRFGTPWPPFDFGSTRELEDVDRAEAEALDLLPKNAPVPEFEGGSGEQDFNEGLEASVEGWRPDQISTMKLAFGDQVQERDGKLQWQGNSIGDLYDHATSDSQYKASLDIGQASPRGINLAAVHGVDLDGYILQMKADDVRHVENRHGSKSADRLPVDRLDFELVPHVWRDPDEVTKGEQGVLRFKKQVDGRLVVVEFARSEKHRRAGIKSIMRES